MSVAVLDVSGMGCPPVDLDASTARIDDEMAGRVKREKVIRKTWLAVLEKLACAGGALQPPSPGTSSLASKATRPAAGYQIALAGRALFPPQSLRDRCQFQAVATIASRLGIAGRQPSSLIAALASATS